ncbi:hypothetical protein V2J09_016534 [Rumex salicifolius]
MMIRMHQSYSVSIDQHTNQPKTIGRSIIGSWVKLACSSPTNPDTSSMNTVCPMHPCPETGRSKKKQRGKTGRQEGPQRRGTLLAVNDDATQFILVKLI